MRKEFYKPYLNGLKQFYIQVKFVKETLVDTSNFVVEFKAISVMDLQKNIITYAKSFGLKVVETSELYVERITTTYSIVNGFTLTDVLRKVGI